MKTIDTSYEIHSSIDKVWRALTRAETIEQWGAGPVQFEAKEGGRFSLWGGSVHGTNVKIVPAKLLVQKWCSHETQDHFYEVSFTLNYINGITTVQLTHKDIADDKYDDFDQGWQDFYFEPIKELLEGSGKL